MNSISGCDFSVAAIFNANEAPAQFADWSGLRYASAAPCGTLKSLICLMTTEKIPYNTELERRSANQKVVKYLLEGKRFRLSRVEEGGQVFLRVWFEG